MPNDLIHNEQTKYLATWLNTIASAVVVLGVVAPVAAVFYGATGSPSLSILTLGGAVWLLAGLGLHLGCTAYSERTSIVNGYELLAFVIMPIAVTAFGWAVVLINERYGQ